LTWVDFKGGFFHLLESNWTGKETTHCDSDNSTGELNLSAFSSEF
jgi:hypothetical protein